MGERLPFAADKVFCLEDTFLCSCLRQPELPLWEMQIFEDQKEGVWDIATPTSIFGKSPKVHLEISWCFPFGELMQFQFWGFSLWKGGPICRALLCRSITGLVELGSQSWVVLSFGFWIYGHLFAICFVFGDFPLAWFGLVCAFRLLTLIAWTGMGHASSGMLSQSPLGSFLSDWSTYSYDNNLLN